MSKAASQFIDFFRWMGALQVVLIHAGNIFVNNADIMKAPHSWFEYLWWFVIAYGFGRQGLMMFFVFSGLLVGGTVLKRMQKNEPFLRKYLIDRIVRIYIVLVPVVLIGMVIDDIGRHVFAGYGVYEIFPGHYNPWLLIPSLFSLQGIWFIPYGTNEALWSLGCECWYYVVFPLIMMPLAAAYAPVRRWVFSGIGVAAFIALAASGSFFALGSVPWVIGAAVSQAKKPLIRSRHLSVAILMIGATIMRLAIPANQFDMYPTKIFTDCGAALLVANLLLTLRFDRSDGFWFCKFPIHNTMGAFSFSLYSIHVPALFFLWGVTEWAIRPQWRAEPATAAHYAMAIFSSLFVMLLAFLLSLVTERRTEPVRRFFHWLIPGGAEKPQAAAVPS